jgi:dihydroxyacetone kinase-like protein
MGLVAAGKQRLTESEFAAAFAGGVDGIRQRGSARPGDKTMVDALLPPCWPCSRRWTTTARSAPLLRSAAAAAEAGMLATISMQASKGRASYLGPRSVGHQDPGATSAWLLVLSAAEVVCLAAAPGGLFQQDKQREEAEGWEN